MSDGYLEGVNNDNLEGAVSLTYYGIRQFPDGEVMGSTYVASDRSKLRGSSLVKSLVVEVVPEVRFYYGMSYWNSAGKIEGY